MQLSFMCGIFEEMVNTLRGIPASIKVWIYVVSALLLILMVRRLIKVNYNKDKGRNFAWLLPIILLIILIVMMSI